jgi:hypothetical protein
MPRTSMAWGEARGRLSKRGTVKYTSRPARPFGIPDASPDGTPVDIPGDIPSDIPGDIPGGVMRRTADSASRDIIS